MKIFVFIVSFSKFKRIQNCQKMMSIGVKITGGKKKIVFCLVMNDDIELQRKGDRNYIEHIYKCIADSLQFLTGKCERFLRTNQRFA